MSNNIDYSKFFPIAEYYEKVVMSIDKRFRIRRKDKFVCCLHDDTDPSLGIIHSKDKGEIFHCFGCNAWGTVIDLHKRVSLKYFNKYIDDERAKVELCNIFGVDISSLPSEVVDIDISSVADKDIRKQLAMAEAMKRFNISDFQNKIIEGKLKNKGIPYYNTLLVTMLNEFKGY